jgi:hypothetical protein
LDVFNFEQRSPLFHKVTVDHPQFLGKLAFQIVAIAVHPVNEVLRLLPICCGDLAVLHELEDPGMVVHNEGNRLPVVLFIISLDEGDERF